MTYLIAYDIADPSRLRQAARICIDYGTRVQYSVFECKLNPKQLDAMLKELENIMKKDEDAVLCYAVCLACEQKIRRLGKTKSLPQDDLYIV